MVARKDIARIVSGYENPRIGVLGSHSALEIMDGAKDENFQTVVFCQKGREAPYKKFSRIADEIIVMNKFSDMASVKAQKKMISTNTIVVPHRSLTAYLGYEAIEKKFTVPMFGNRMLFRAEERDEKRNQYYLLKKAGIRYPRIFSNPKDIDAPAIVKVQEKNRKMERAFFTVTSHKDYIEKSEKKA